MLFCRIHWQIHIGNQWSCFWKEIPISRWMPYMWWENSSRRQQNVSLNASNWWNTYRVFGGFWSWRKKAMNIFFQLLSMKQCLCIPSFFFARRWWRPSNSGRTHHQRSFWNSRWAATYLGSPTRFWARRGSWHWHYNTPCWVWVVDNS